MTKMEMKKRNIIINATMLFVIATLWQQTLHELGHFVAAIVLHSKDVTLYHNYVEHDASSISMTSRLIIAAAGPLISLLSGLLFHFVCANYKQRDILFLFMLFMSSFGYINFGGYLLMSPFFKSGDTGFVFSQLGFPLWLVVSLSVAGAVFLFFSMKKLSKYFVEMASEEIINSQEQRATFIASLIRTPLFLGIIVTVVLNLPVPTFLSLLYPLCSPFTFFWIYGHLLKKNYTNLSANTKLEGFAVIDKSLIVAIIFTVIVNRLLVHGVRW
jgi:hypothetical protein